MGEVVVLFIRPHGWLRRNTAVVVIITTAA